MSSIAVRRALTVATCVLSFGALQGCDNAGSAPAPLPAANLPADAPKAPVDSKTVMEKTKGSSSAAFDSTVNTSLQKGTAPGK